MGTLPPRAACPWGVRPGPAALCFGARGVRAWVPVINPGVHALVRWRCALWVRHGSACRGACPVPQRRVSKVGHSPSADGRWLLRAARARCPFSLGAGCAGVKPHHQPHSAHSCELALCGVQVAKGRPGAGASTLCEGCLQLSTLPSPTPCPSGVRPGARFPLAAGPACVRVGPHSPACACPCRRCAPWGRRVRLGGAPEARYGFPWHLLPCRCCLCVVCASPISGTRLPLLPGTEAAKTGTLFYRCFV